MLILDVHEAKTHLSRLVDQAAAGEEIVIAKPGTPVARLVTLENDLTPRTFGQMRGKLRISDDFDAPLSMDVLTSFTRDR